MTASDEASGTPRTIATCASCGQQMHPTDWKDRVLAENAALIDELAAKERELAQARNDLVNANLHIDNDSAAIDALTERAEKAERELQQARGEAAGALSTADWCAYERSLLGAVDGYDYNSGVEFGLRKAEIYLRALKPSPASGEQINQPNTAPPSREVTEPCTASSSAASAAAVPDAARRLKERKRD